ncbi:MAG: phosphomethylpyrimidine synthase ThiC [Candidatus Gastranaerophilales bacterium]|nr:phosphomethylpyrimidine synthase ThiC [Candidatus Gastranaerophilales bacterium]
MATQMQQAKAKIITEEMYQIAQRENLTAEYVRDGVANGRVVILKNNKKTDFTPVALGEGMKVKVMSCVGAHSSKTPLVSVLDKVRVIQSAGVDVIYENSSCEIAKEVRNAIFAISKVPMGACPTIQAGVSVLEQTGDISNLTKEDLLNAIENQCANGMDFVSLNCGLTKDILDKLKYTRRLFKINSPSGMILSCMMKAKGIENPLYEYFDEVLNIIKEYDVVLMLSSAFKSECTSDAFDSVEIAEMVIFGELVQRAREKNVQVMINGIGQVSLNKIPLMVQNIKEMTDGAPLYVAKANACDCALGNDNISSAIGSALAAYQGADLLNATTSMDRIGNSNSANIREGIISAKIAAHCADLARGNIDAIKQNYKMSYARLNNDIGKQIENNIDRVPFDNIDYSQAVNNLQFCSKYALDEMFDRYFSR